MECREEQEQGPKLGKIDPHWMLETEKKDLQALWNGDMIQGNGRKCQPW